MSRHLLIFLDKTLFQAIFFLIVFLSKLRRTNKQDYWPKLEGSESFLVIRPGGLGDGIMCIPFLKVLRKEFPKNKITLMCVEKNSAVFHQLSLFNELIVIDSLASLLKNVFKLISNQFDVVFDLESFRKMSSIIAYLSGANIRIGFDTNIRRVLYTHFVTYANEKCYESLNMIRQLNVLDINVSQSEATDISFTLPDSTLERARSILQSYHINSANDIIIAIVPGVLKEHHRWIMSNFSSLIELIQHQDEEAIILLLGAPSDIQDANEVLLHLKEQRRVINLVEKTTFIEVLGILKACKVLIACDGGIIYMAAAMGCNTISLWGPGVMERFKPPGDKHIGLRKDYFCVPCVNYGRLGEFPKCLYERKCIKDISPADVFEKYVKLRDRLKRRIVT